MQQYAYFTIPIHDPGDNAEALNRFLRSHRITRICQRFSDAGPDSAWAVCVTWETGGGEAVQGAKERPRIDYREVLSEADFAVYARLRELRKQLAAHDGVPPYAVFTNEQLAAMVRGRVGSLDALRAIAGIGEAKTDKYGQAMLDCLAQAGDAGTTT